MPRSKKNSQPSSRTSLINQPSIVSFFSKAVDRNPKRAGFKFENFHPKNDNAVTEKTVTSKFLTATCSSVHNSLSDDDDVVIIEECPLSSSPSLSISELPSVGFTKSELAREKTYDKNSFGTDGLEKEPNAIKTSESYQDLLVELETPVVSAPENSEKSETYYHKHFLHVLNNVLSDEEYTVLFNEADLNVINAFRNLSEGEQNLFIRLFGRKHKWLKSSTLKYPEISADLSPYLDRLMRAGLLHNDEHLEDLDAVLGLLLMPELKQLSKCFGIGLDAKGKEQIIDAFCQHCQQQANIKRFFNSTGIEKKVISKAKELAGRSFRLQTEPRKVFIRVLLLFSLTGIAEDEEESANGGQQKKLVTLLMVEKGQLRFPKYEINKCTPVFSSRESLVRYEEAKQLELDILNSFSDKRYQEAYEYFLTAEKLYSLTCKSEETKSDTCLPAFLQRFTSSYVYIRCLHHGVEVLQRLKNYEDAVRVLRLLLEQQDFCKIYRGHWWDRLTLLLDYHLKDPKLTIKGMCQALKDPNLRLAHKYTLIKRAQKIIDQVKKQEAKVTVSCKKRKITKKTDDISFLQTFIENEECLQEPPKVTIVGRLLPGCPTGYKNVFVLSSLKELDGNEDVSLVSVEELALDHYRQQGYTQGIHGEGSTVVSLFCLLFWDIIYGSGIPDVFRSPYQSWPLDINTKHFYAKRRVQIDEQIKLIRESSKMELENIVQSCWEKNEGCTSLVSWDRFTGPTQVKELVSSFSNEALAGIFERLTKDFRHCCSGFPDLIVWSPTSHDVKVVEVKSPNDRLSAKQIVWLHFLLKLKVSVEVCHINVVGAKKLKLTEKR